MNKGRFFILVLLMTAVLLAVATTGLLVGQYPIQIEDFTSIWSSQNSTAKLVILELRLPRIICSIFIGALLAVTGSCMQGIFRNPLVEPSFIGISAGAASAVVLFLVVLKPILIQYIPLNEFVIPCVAFVGSVVTVKIVINLASIQGRISIGALLLSGIAVNAFCGAGCWISIIDTQGNKITAKGNHSDIVFPVNAIGGKARITGKFKEHVLSLEQTIKYEAHMAKDRGEKFDVSSVKNPKTLYRIHATGAVIFLAKK
mgnify:CR=1 FL=1